MTKAPNSPAIKVCSMLAAAMGAMSAPTVLSTGVLSFLNETTTAEDSEDKLLARTKANTLRMMSKPITLEAEELPLEDILNYISTVTEAELEPIWIDDSFDALGMDPGTLISIRVDNAPALSVLERVLKRAERIEGIGSEYTWQLSDIGTIECGPKTALNEHQRIELYDIADLILVIPDFDNAPDFNLQSALSSGGSGGGGSGPFGGGGGQDVDIEPQGERAQKIIDLIESTVEPDQWANAGGDGASLTVYRTSLIINAPDYIHRKIGGYDFWPSRLHRVRTSGSQRWIEVKPDPAMRKSP
jgi:hypothetical protein